MSETTRLAYQAIDEHYAEESAHTRRQLVAGAAATLGGMGLLGVLNDAEAATGRAAARDDNEPAKILAVAATAEVLATIVNTVGPERIRLDAVTKANVEAAARHELIHYEYLSAVGAKALTKRICVPDAVFASQEPFLTTLAIGDQIFVNAYLLATTVFAPSGRNSKLARITAEHMGVEAVHRALALQSLGRLGNDRAFMRFTQPEAAGVPGENLPGFRNIMTAVEHLQGAGFGFGEQGAGPGAFYEYDEVSKRTPNPAGVNIRQVA